jgi:hypothetical protein
MKVISMANQDDHGGSGNDGSWFLEAVGAVPPSPTPSETVAALELDNTLPDMGAVVRAELPGTTTTSFDGGTGTSTSTFEPVRKAPPGVQDPTGEFEIPVPSSSPRADLDAGLSRVLQTKRSFRWSVAALGIFLVVVVGLAFLWLPVALRQDAIAIRQTYADSALALRQHIPAAQTSLDAITDPDTPPEELSLTVPIISQLDSLAHGLAVAATAPLPRTLPLLPNEEVSALVPLQDTAQIHAAQASEVARQLGFSYVYRTTIPQLLTTGDLPTSADTQTINALSLLLASSLVDDSSAISDLPTTESASDVNSAARAGVERYASWQDEYLTALSEGDGSGAAELIDELVDLRTGLETELETAMSTARVDIDQQIVELAADLESFLRDLTRQ